MRALIVHYHLKPGGVTTVIRRQLSALSARGIDASVLSGEAARGQGGAVSVEPALGYDQEPRTAAAGGSTRADAPDRARVGAIVRAVRREAGALGGDTVVHVHNPTIRKNSSMLAALSELAAGGTRLVLHVHDLAEDWRPDVYSVQPYPEGAVWACINRFDAAALKAAGAGRVSYLPNPVPCPAATRRAAGADERAGPASAAARGKPGLILYPVRGIRRKNLGEAVLLSLFMREGGRIGVTLPPTSAKDEPYYEGWLAAAASLYAPVSFGLGLGRGLEELYAASASALTTSIKEGFGMSYLEPASRGLPTLGRRLPRVVADFEAEGLSFPGLYRSIAVPSGLFDEEAFAKRVRLAATAALAAYGLEGADATRSGTASAGLPDAGLPDAGLPYAGFPDAVVHDVLGGRAGASRNADDDARGADFGRLDEPAQEQTLRSISRSKRARAAMIAANPFLEGWDAAADAAEPLGPEALSPWSEDLYGERLETLYREALDSGSASAADRAAPRKATLLRLYLTPEAFYGVGV